MTIIIIIIIIEKKLEKEVRGLEWQGKLLTERKSDLQLCKNECFSWPNKIIHLRTVRDSASLKEVSRLFQMLETKLTEDHAMTHLLLELDYFLHG